LFSAVIINVILPNSISYSQASDGLSYEFRVICPLATISGGELQLHLREKVRFVSYGGYFDSKQFAVKSRGTV